MSLLLESVKIERCVPKNLEYHNARLNESRFQLFGKSEIIDLKKIIKVPEYLTNDVYKCRIIYAESIREVEFIPYTPRNVKTLELVDGGSIEYGHKFLDRSKIDFLKKGSKADDILIVKNGYITDASSANVVFQKADSWITPAEPLLKGTKRRYLLDVGKIQEENIKVNDLKFFRRALLINAMLDFDIDNFIDVKNIFQESEL